MKKIILLALLCFTTIVLVGCGSNHEEQYDQQRYTVTGTISYHNFEKDRGDGIETSGGIYHAAIILQLDTKSMFSPNSDGQIVLGCISGDDNKLYRRLLQITGSASPYNWTEVSAQPIQLPGNLDQKSIVASITKPVTSFALAQELLDGGRIGSCRGYSDITGVVLLPNASSK